MSNAEPDVVWRNQPVDEVAMTAEMAEQATGFQRRLRALRVREHAAGIAVAIIFSAYFFIATHILVKTGAALIVLADLYSMWQLERRLRRSHSVVALLACPCVEFHRQSLVNHRDTLRSIWRWSILPLLPGLVVLRWGIALESARFDGWTNAGIAAILLIVYALNDIAARRLQEQINRLPEHWTPA